LAAGTGISNSQPDLIIDFSNLGHPRILRELK
jgi:hypothetical protein